MSGGKDRYKEMADILHNASLHDVLPEFDKNAVWGELEPGLPRKKSAPLFYMRYAAVAALLLILVSIGVWQAGEDDRVTVVKQNVAPVAPPITMPKDSVVPQPIISNMVAKEKPARARRHAVSNIPATVTLAGVNEPEVSDTPSSTAEVAVLTDTKYDTLPGLPRRRARAVHLTDVGREAKSMVIKQPAPQSFGEKVGYFIYGEELPDKEDNKPAGLRSLLKN